MHGRIFTGDPLAWVSAEQGGTSDQSSLLTTFTTTHRGPRGSDTDPAVILQGCSWPEHAQLHSFWEAPAMTSPCSWQGAPTLQPCSGYLDGDPATPRESSDGHLEGPAVGLGPLDGRRSPEAFYAGGPSLSPGGRWFRKSYVEALRNPVPLGSSSEESLLDEAEDAAAGRLAQDSRPRMATSRGQRVPTHPQSLRESHPRTDRTRMPSRRSRSWDKPFRSPFCSKPDEAQWALGDSPGLGPERLPGGQAAGTAAVGLGAAVDSPESPQEKAASAGVYSDSSTSWGPVPGAFSDQPPKPLCPRGPRDAELGAPSQVLGVSPALLQLGAMTLPGTRDRGGRAVVQVCTGGPLWAGEHASSTELTRLLMCLCSIPRKEVRDLGLVILVDARKGLVVPALSQALAALQNTVPPIIHSILLLVDKESALRPDKDATIQYEVVSSLKALHKLIDSSQLTAEFDGSFPYSHSDWVCFRRKLEVFMANCRQAVAFLQDAACSLNARRTLSTAQEVTELIGRHRAVMRCVLEDALLVALRLEGGTVLARLSRDELGASEDGRDTIEAAAGLYERVDEEVHGLVLASNRCLQWLEGLQELRSQEAAAQAEGRFERQREHGLHPVGLPSPNNEKGEQEGSRGLQGAAARVGEPDGTQTTQHPLLWSSRRLARLQAGGGPPVLPRQQVQRAQAAGWRTSCRELPAHLAPKAPSSLPDAEHLGSYCQGALTGEAVPGSGQELWPCQAQWTQGQQTSRRLEEAFPEAAPSCRSPPLPQEASPSGQDELTTLEIVLGPGGPALGGTPSSLGDPPDTSSPCRPEPPLARGPRLRKQPLKMMKKTQCFEAPTPDSGPREPRHPGHTGVHIKDLEVTSTMTAETPPLLRSCSLSSPPRVHHPEGAGRPRAGSRLHHIMAEMVSTEREYVRSLGYVIDNYFPEMERTDLPQDLRGKRSAIFGNLEKLHDFHGQHFLRELERCHHCPLAVGRGFLRHEKQFGMYALYSKNKPCSDALLGSRGNAFFKARQQALGDKMDLASYLLKPVQRMSKYALLLGDLVKEARRSPAWGPELSQLQAAEDMVRFQLRHGNDLLAMDAVRGCDVDLKEQGPLRCQDEFVVCCRRRKYLRRVFLFDDLILFSKTKKVESGHDIFVYKQSFKTAEIGLTENVGDDGLRFEIWFRRRRRPQDTYVLQASSADVKAAWTGVIGRILWQQALRNRELRMQEMVSMGIGNKPFMDIKPSEAAISDRATDYIMKGTESRSRASIAVSSFDHTSPFKRPHSTISDSSTSSSSSQSSSVLGSLNLHVYPRSPGLPALCPWPCDVRARIEEGKLEQETGSQPSTTTWSSESSHCTSGDSTDSAHGPTHPGLSPLDNEGASTVGSRPPARDASPALSRRSARRRLGGGQVTTSHTVRTSQASTVV